MHHGGSAWRRGDAASGPVPDPLRELPAARAPGLPGAEPRGARLHARLQARRARRRSGRHHPARGGREPASLHHPRRLGVPAQGDRGRPPAGAELRPSGRPRRAAARDHERDAAHRHRADPHPALRLPARQGLVGLHRPRRPRLRHDLDARRARSSSSTGTSSASASARRWSASPTSSSTSTNGRRGWATPVPTSCRRPSPGRTWPTRSGSPRAPEPYPERLRDRELVRWVDDRLEILNRPELERLASYERIEGTRRPLI